MKLSVSFSRTGIRPKFCDKSQSTQLGLVIVRTAAACVRIRTSNAITSQDSIPGLCIPLRRKKLGKCRVMPLGTLPDQQIHLHSTKLIDTLKTAQLRICLPTFASSFQFLCRQLGSLLRGLSVMHWKTNGYVEWQ